MHERTEFRVGFHKGKSTVGTKGVDYMTSQFDSELRSNEAPSRYRYIHNGGSTACTLHGFKIGWDGRTYGLLFWGKAGAVTATRLAGIRMNLQYLGGCTLVRKSDVRAPGKQGIFLEFREPIDQTYIDMALRYGQGGIEVSSLDALQNARVTSA